MVTSCGVVSTLSEMTCGGPSAPDPLTRPSVMVPPVSMSMVNTDPPRALPRGAASDVLL